MEWLKLTSNGILRGSLSQSTDVVQLTWIKLLALMSETHFRNGRFEYTAGKPYSLEYIAINCGLTRDMLEACLCEYEEDINPDTNEPRIAWDDQTLILTNWNSYQEDKRKNNEEEKKPPKTKEELEAITRKLTNEHPEAARDGLSYGFNDNIISKQGEVLRKDGETKTIKRKGDK